MQQSSVPKFTRYKTNKFYCRVIPKFRGGGKFGVNFIVEAVSAPPTLVL